MVIDLSGQLSWIFKVIWFLLILLVVFKIYKRIIPLLDLWVSKRKKYLILEMGLLDQIAKKKDIEIVIKGIDLSKKIKQDIDDEMVK